MHARDGGIFANLYLRCGVVKKDAILEIFFHTCNLAVFLEIQSNTKFSVWFMALIMRCLNDFEMLTK